MATIFMMAGFHFMSDDLVLEVSGLQLFKFFTVDSNILIGLISLVFACFEYKTMKDKRKIIPKELYIMKYMFTIGVLVTFLVTVLYLAPFAPTGFFSMFQNSNLFYHFIIPVLSFITLVFFEKNNQIKFKHTILGLVPVFIYAIFYVLNIITHIENGKVPFAYDWYGFARGGFKATVFVFIFMHVATYILSLVVWLLNRRKDKNNIDKS